MTKGFTSRLKNVFSSFRLGCSKSQNRCLVSPYCQTLFEFSSFRSYYVRRGTSKSAILLVRNGAYEWLKKHLKKS